MDTTQKIISIIISAFFVGVSQFALLRYFVKKYFDGLDKKFDGISTKFHELYTCRNSHKLKLEKHEYKLEELEKIFDEHKADCKLRHPIEK